MSISHQRMIVRRPHRDLCQKRSLILGQWAEVEIVDGRSEELKSLVGAFHFHFHFSLLSSRPYVGDEQDNQTWDPLKWNPLNRRQQTHRVDCPRRHPKYLFCILEQIKCRLTCLGDRV